MILKVFLQSYASYVSPVKASCFYVKAEGAEISWRAAAKGYLEAIWRLSGGYLEVIWRLSGGVGGLPEVGGGLGGPQAESPRGAGRGDGRGQQAAGHHTGRGGRAQTAPSEEEENTHIYMYSTCTHTCTHIDLLWTSAIPCSVEWKNKAV